MAPLLIDSRDLLKLGLITVLVTILVFGGGFLLGHQRAATFYQAGSDIQSLALPEQVMAVENNVDSQVPSIIEAGEEIDVDQPETLILSDNGSKNTLSDSLKATAPVAVSSSDNKEISALQKSVTAETVNVEQQADRSKDNLTAETQTPELQSTDSVSNADDNARAVKKGVSPTDASIVTTFTMDELSKIKYSVQVGVYGRLINAENMMNMLQAQQYEAYVTDYTNKKNEIRYNVRFGYFADKKTALATLSKFKADKKGDGYLVRFSAKNIVKIAGAVDIERAVDVPTHGEEAGKGSTPLVVPSDITQDKISRADVLSDMLATAGLTTTN